jgi:hypothetical protein
VLVVALTGFPAALTGRDVVAVGAKLAARVAEVTVGLGGQPPPGDHRDVGLPNLKS